MNRLLPLGWLLAGWLVCAVSLTDHARAADEWTDVTGQHTMLADFLGVWGDKAVFRLPDGSRKPVELKNLQASSRLKALELAEQSNRHVQEFQQQIEAKIEAANAMGPERIPPAETDAAAYQPLPDNASLRQTILHLDAQVKNGHLRAFWDALPPKHRGDLEKLVVAFANKVDPEVLRSPFELVDRVTRLLAGREAWIFAYPRLQPLLGEDETRARMTYRAVLGIIQGLTNPETWSAERLREGDLDGWIADLDQQVAGHVYFLSSQSPTSAAPDFEIQEVDETNATVTFALPAEAPAATPPPPPMQMTRVEGRWVPQPMAAQWDETMAEANAGLKSMPPDMAGLRDAVAAADAAMDSYLAPLETAESREDFHQAIDRMVSDLTVKALPLIMQFAPASGASRGSPGFQGEMEGYGSEMEGYGSEMMMEGSGAGEYGSGSNQSPAGGGFNAEGMGAGSPMAIPGGGGMPEPRREGGLGGS